ncbi:MAG: hypothetical protein ACLFQV_02430 [Vulcanimicrobiota bacterium]
MKIMRKLHIVAVLVIALAVIGCGAGSGSESGGSTPSTGGTGFNGSWQLENSNATDYQDLDLSVDGSTVTGTLKTRAETSQIDEFDGNVTGTVSGDDFSGRADGRIKQTSSSGEVTYIYDVAYSLNLTISDDENSLNGTITLIQVSGETPATMIPVTVKYERK